MKEILKYIQEGITINKGKDGYNIFTPQTQRFKINSLEELTPERFEEAIERFKEYQEAEQKIFDAMCGGLPKNTLTL